MRNRLPYLLALLGLGLAGLSGFLVSNAVGQAEPTRTVTIDVATGPAGPQGPPGPQGEQGEQGVPGATGAACPVGFSNGYLVINHPGGQVTTFTCLKDE